MVKYASAGLAAAACLLGAAGARGQEGAAPAEGPVESGAPPLALMAGIELRPAPRFGAMLDHRAASARLVHALTFGLGPFPDVELRSGPRFAALAPAYPWLAYRIRRVGLTGLPPIEQYLGVGLGFASDAAARISFDAGAGLRFQIPPLAAEPAGDAGTYLAENVHADLHVALRVRLW